MQAFLGDYLTIVLMFICGLLFGGGMLALGSLIRPNRRQRQKYVVYESGVDPIPAGWSQSQVRYYIFALMFVLFDVEAVFVFPWAVNLEQLGVFGLVEMLIFIAVLAIGLVYAWRKQVLRWA